jgi:transposase InsO family protein
MPWQGVSAVDLRLQFITEYLTESYSMTELAAAYGISRKTAYYWVHCSEREGPGRLAGASRRPHTLPHATPPEIVARLIAARQRHPSWGAGKLRDWLVRRHPETAWPCRDTIHQVLVRHGKVRRRRRPRPAVCPPHTLTAPTRPNLVWTVDFKGQFRTGDGALCYPFTLRDGYSRYVLRCTALPALDHTTTQPQFARAFTEYGLPDCIRSDNGPPFAVPTSLARLSRLAVWWLRLGIRPERIHPGRPGENGSHEQFHRVLKRDTACPPATSRAAQQRRFTAFVAEYNHERPHDAVAHAPPATRYAPSARPYPAQLPPLEYPDGWEVRRVSTSGQIKWDGRSLFLTEVLAGEDVAAQPIDDGVWLLHFAACPLAVFHAPTWSLQTPLDRSPLPQVPGS